MCTVFGFLVVCVNPHGRNLLFKPAALKRKQKQKQRQNKRHSYSPDPVVPSGRLILHLFDAMLDVTAVNSQSSFIDLSIDSDVYIRLLKVP